MHREIGVVN